MGPFLKAMLSETKLFTVSKLQNVPSSWTFYLMPEIKERGLCSQDTVHLLAKLRTRLLGPSNIIVLGVESPCRSHIQYVYNNIPKERHGFTQQVIDNKDKQNYGSIATLVGDDLNECLTEASSSIHPTRTIIYLSLMRCIRDARFEKTMTPLKRVSLLWEVVFFMRIWRCWLFENGYSESDHFITTNAYTCIEIKAHLMLSLLYNVINGKFPKDVIRVWLTGSQGCEQLFRLLKSMTPVFSTIINFSLKGVLERIHKLNYISSIECTEEIIFPRVQRRLLQLNNETDETFLIPTLVEVENEIRESKNRAILLSQKCRMELNPYDDDCLVKDTTHLVEDAIHHDQEDEDTNIRDDDEEQPVAESDIAQIREDIAVIQLKKKSNTSLPTYIQSAEKGSIHRHSYSTVVDSRKSKKTPFVEYIRKTTALYLLQENYQVSNQGRTQTGFTG